MFDVLARTLKSCYSLIFPRGSNTRKIHIAEEEDREIEFHTISPLSAGRNETLAPHMRMSVCPITRQALKPGQIIYECRACRMTYSEEGWEFQRQVDKGRCCGCRNRKTVFQLIENSADVE